MGGPWTQFIKKKEKSVKKYKNRRNIMSVYNGYELRFLQVLVDKRVYDIIVHLQTVQPMYSKKVFLNKDYMGMNGLIFEKKERKKRNNAGVAQR